jgi:Family of unknown function (DUF6523)
MAKTSPQSSSQSSAKPAAKAPGFGKPPARKASPNSGRREAAAQRFDDMKTKGMPEFAIFARIRDQKPWFPIGSLAVNRTSKINEAIFQNEDDLQQGAFRLFPRLRKQQANLEYGYRLKEFKDDPIQLAERPAPTLPNPFQAAIAQVRQTVAGWVGK